jgi:hypothetical protein
MTRSQQIIAALDWATGNKERNTYVKVESGVSAKLSIIETRGNSHYAAMVELADGVDFTAILDAKERERDEAELQRLQIKLGR